MTETQSGIECTLWLGEMKCHLVVAEIHPPPCHSWKQRPSSYPYRKVKSRATGHHYPSSVGVTYRSVNSLKKVFSLFQVKLHHTDVNTQYWQILSLVNIRKSFLTWLFFLLYHLLGSWKHELEGHLWQLFIMNMLFINISGSKIRPSCMCL